MKSYTEMTLCEGEIVAAGRGGNPADPRTWLYFGRVGHGLQINFTGKDRPLAEKIARVIEAHRSQESAQ